MKATGLLSALRKYRVRENSDPIENFVTEAFAWLLKNDADFSSFFLRSLRGCHPENADAFDSADWSTQCNWGGKFPDMVCELPKEDFAYVFEHKVWSLLHENQLENYRNFAKEKWKERYRMILITAHRGQHQQEPDEALCWEEVYRKIRDYLLTPAGKSSAIRPLIEDFLNLLRDIGLAPLGVFRREEIIGYAGDFRHRMNILWEHVAAELKRLLAPATGNETFGPLAESPDFRVEKDLDKWGRIGLSLFREWRPGLFVGSLLDPHDHGVRYSEPEKGPDVCLIVSFDESLHHLYGSKEYASLRQSLQNAFDQGNSVWRFHDHLEDPKLEDGQKNLWHPIHIRRPLIDILSAANGEGGSIQEQASEVAAAILEPIRTIFASTRFLAVRGSHPFADGLRLSGEQICYRLAQQLGTEEDLASVDIFADRNRSYLCVKLPWAESGRGVIGFSCYFDRQTPEIYFFTDPGREASEVHRLVAPEAKGHGFDESGNHLKLILDDDEALSSLSPIDLIRTVLGWFKAI